MALKNFLSEVEFLAQYPMVGMAVTDSTGPVPGYLFGEINAITYVDDGNNCRMLVSFLVSRLKADSPIVCIKVLKLLIYLVRNGHSQVINELKIHEVPLKEARNFNGPADDIYGNSFYQMIRKMSKELLDMIFSENREVTEKTFLPDNVALTGYGSDTRGKMSGFGYSAKTEKSVSDVVSDGFSSFVEKLFPSPDKETDLQDMSHIGDALPKYKPIVIEKSLTSDLNTPSEASFKSIPATTILSKQRKVKVHRPGRAGGGWESSSEEEENDETPPLMIESCKESLVSLESNDSSKAFIECCTDLSEESKIVSEIAINKPLNELNFAHVQQLCKKCSSLNCEDILSLTLNKVSNVEEFIQLRSLVFIEYLLFHDVISLESLVRIVLPYLQTLIEEDKNIKPSVKLKSMKICKTIEILNKKIQQKIVS